MRSTARTVRDFWRDQRRELARHADDLASTPSPDTVHDLRAAGRRIKATVRTFRPLLRTSLADSLLAGFDKVNHALGEVRDAEVVFDLVAEIAGPDDPLLAELTDRRDRLRTAASEMLAAEQTAQLFTLVDDLADDPWRGRYRKKGPPGRLLADRVDRTQQRVARAWQALVTMEGATLSEADLDAQVHLLRRRAKSARFSLGAIGKHHAADKYASVSDALGIIQDAVVIVDVLGDRTDAASVAAVTEARRQAEEARASSTELLQAAVPRKWWPTDPRGTDTDEGRDGHM